MNYFELFELSEQFDIDLDVLTQRYNALHRLTHPDRLTGANEKHKQVYMQKNVQVNDALNVLSDDISRGEHLIEVRGTQLPSEQEAISDTTFLMEQMDLREQLASAHDAASFEQLKRTLAEKTADYRDRINLLLDKKTEDANHAAGLELGKLKFMRKLAIETKENEIKALDL